MGARVLFVRNGAERFVRLDRDLLAASYQITDYHVPSPRVINPLALWHQIGASDLVFGWFASWHTFLPMLFARALGKPSLLVVGGYDLARMPEIGYGHQRGGMKALISRATMRASTCLVTNAHFSKQEAQNHAGIPADRVRVVYHGVPDAFSTLALRPRAPIAFTVGNLDRANLWRKGIEPFVRAAALLPDVEFVVVGAWKDDAITSLRALATPNVTFTGRVDDQSLLRHYSRASVYVQASLHEGFGLSVAEAMLAGCVPVVTRAGALPEVVGNAGLYLPSNSPRDIAVGIREGLAVDDRARERARERILTTFPLATRQRLLTELIEGMVSKRAGKALATPHRLET